MCNAFVVVVGTEEVESETRAGLEVGGEEREVQEVAYIITICQAIANGSRPKNLGAA